MVKKKQFEKKNVHLLLSWHRWPCWVINCSAMRLVNIILQCKHIQAPVAEMPSIWMGKNYIQKECNFSKITIRLPTQSVIKLWQLLFFISQSLPFTTMSISCLKVDVQRSLD